MSKSAWSLTNATIYFCVQWCVWDYNWAKVYKVFFFNFQHHCHLIDGKISVTWLRTLVFLRLIVKSKSEHADENWLSSVCRSWDKWATSAALQQKEDQVLWQSSDFSLLLDLQGWKVFYQFLYGA